MTETDDIVASLRAWAPLVASGYTVPAAGQVMENAATALTARDAQIERLQEHSAARAQDIITLGQQIERLTLERDELLSRTTEYARQNVDLEARATTAERDLAEARTEVERKDAALSPFADMADYIDAETEGFSDTDEVQVMFNDLLFARWPISHFRAARAALAKGGADGDA